LWRKTFGIGTSTSAFSVTNTNDGGFAITGNINSNNNDILVAKFNSLGNTQWTRTIGGSSYDISYSITETSDNGLVVTGGTMSYGNGNFDLIIAKFDSSGNLLWTKTLGGSNEDFAFSVIETSDNNLVTTGWTKSYGGSDKDVLVVKFDNNGNEIWTKTIGGTNIDEGYALTELNNGQIAVVGYTTSYGGTDNDILILMLDSSGDIPGFTGITEEDIAEQSHSITAQSHSVPSVTRTVSAVNRQLTEEDVALNLATAYEITGLVAVGSGTPFYTDKSSNPYIINLGVSENEEVEFSLNATGTLYETYRLYFYTNLTDYPSISDQTEQFNVKIINNAPNVDLVILNSTDPLTDDSDQDLTCYTNIADLNGDNVYANYTWYKDGIEIESLRGQSGPVTTDSLTLIAILDSRNTTTGDKWSCSVSGYDNIEYSEWVSSNNVSIKEISIPTVVILNSTNPLTNDTNQDLTVWVNQTFFGIDKTTYAYNWYKDDTLNGTTLITDGLIGYWPFDYDYKDYWSTHDGIDRNTEMSDQHAKVGSAGLELESVGVGGGECDFVYTDFEIDNYLSNGFTFSAWVWLAAGDVHNGGDGVVSNYDGLQAASHNHKGYSFKINSQEKPHLELIGASGLMSRQVNDPIPVEEWHHIAVSWDGTTSDANGIILYIDGLEADSFISNAGPMGSYVQAAERTTEFGRHWVHAGPCGAGFDGKLDEIMIWNRALSDRELNQVYQGGRYGGIIMDSSQTTRYDEWKVGARGLNDNYISAEYNSSTLEILNSIPSTTLVILNSTDVLVNDTAQNLTCYATVTDIDLDNVYVDYTWFKNSVEVESLRGQSNLFNQDVLTLINTLDSANTNPGDNWICSVRGYDQIEYEESWKNSSSLEIPNLICTDVDNDGYGDENGNFGTLFGCQHEDPDCDDTNESINPGASETCGDGIDFDCNGEDSNSYNLGDDCGIDGCADITICDGLYNSKCASHSSDGGVCAICNASGQPIYDETQDEDCDDDLYCNSEETCFDLYMCQDNIPINCSGNDINTVASCYYNPDDINFTFDYREEFYSECIEPGECTQGNETITHSCDKNLCGAECENNNDCDGDYVCNLINCSCILSGELFCGDNIKNLDEECDINDFDGKNCADYGFNSGSLSCNPDCTIDSSKCFNQVIQTDGGGGGGGGRRTYQCNDRKDNDKDGLIDMKDPGCEDKKDDDETNPIKCKEKWVCNEWKPEVCPENGIQTRECTEDNNCETEEFEEPTTKKCDYKEPEKYSPPIQEGFFIVEAEINNGFMDVMYKVNNYDQNPIKGLEIEFNINLDRSTKIVDYIDTFDVEDNIIFNRRYKIGDLKNADYNIFARLYAKGKQVADFKDTVNLGLRVNKKRFRVTGGAFKVQQ